MAAAIGLVGGSYQGAGALPGPPGAPLGRPTPKPRPRLCAPPLAVGPSSALAWPGPALRKARPPRSPPRRARYPGSPSREATLPGPPPRRAGVRGAARPYALPAGGASLRYAREALAGATKAADALGPRLGPLACTGIICLAEAVPLLPTQPLILGAGLLFGPVLGAGCALAGSLAAASLAFAGTRLVAGTGSGARRKGSGGERGGSSAAPGGLSGPVPTLPHSPARATLDVSSATGPPVDRAGTFASLLDTVRGQVEKGGPWRQAAAVAALRATPFVPCSVLNYCLGLTDIPFLPFLLGTLPSLLLWAAAYGSAGGAARHALLRGASPDAILSELAAAARAAGERSGKLAAAAIASAALLGGLLALSARRSSPPSRGERAATPRGTG